MSQEIFEIVRRMNLRDIQTQMALQCAPLIAGVKISNLLIIQKDNLNHVRTILKNTCISFYVLVCSEERTVLLLYNREAFEDYLSEAGVQSLLMELGYEGMTFLEILYCFRIRYQNYMNGIEAFPHEMGVLLGYPIEDVEGFIQNEGKNFLAKGYWKVYANPSVKRQLFRQFELAKETIIRLVSNGVSMNDIIESYNCPEQNSSKSYQNKQQKAAI